MSLEFKQLWTDIKYVSNYSDYATLRNAIVDAQTSNEIDDQEKATLLENLVTFCKSQNILTGGRMADLEMDRQLYCRIEGVFLYEHDSAPCKYFDKGCFKCPNCIEITD